MNSKRFALPEVLAPFRYVCSGGGWSLARQLKIRRRLEQFPRRYWPDAGDGTWCATSQQIRRCSCPLAAWRKALAFSLPSQRFGARANNEMKQGTP